jgi:hypothetical protein
VTNEGFRVGWLPALPYVLAGHVIRLAVALVVTHPFASVVERMLGGWPGGDRMLFEPGALMLGEVLRVHGVPMSGFLEQGALAMLGMLPVGVVVNAFVIASLVVGNPRDVRDVASLAIDRMVPIAVLTLAAMLVAGGALAASVVVREGMRAALPFDARTNDLLNLFVPVIGLMVAAAAVLVTDLARVAAVQSRLDTARALVRSLETIRLQPWQMVGAFGARASAGVFLVAGGLVLPVSVGMTTDARAVVVVAVQQIVLFGLACLRASWLARVTGLGSCKSSNPCELHTAGEKDSERT